MSETAPFHRPIRVDALPPNGLTQTIEANAAERAAVAALNRLLAIAALTATLTVRRRGRDGAEVIGHVHAEITQTCVVTLEPFPAVVDESIDLSFAPAEERRPARRDGEAEAEAVEFGGEDPPDPIVDGRIDLGAVAAEFFALGLDPYPRKPGVAFDAPAQPNDKPSSFAALAKLKKKR